MMNNVRREHLFQIYKAAVSAVHPSRLVPANLSLRGERLQLRRDILPISAFKRIFVAGAGKATGEMAVEVERIFGELIVDGVVAVKHFPKTLKYIRPIIAGHPAPDANSVFAAQEILQLVQQVQKDDLLIFLLSGGASSLMTDLPDFCTTSDLNLFYSRLVNSGASIKEMNAIRKHLSALKGGKLARACKGTIATFIISDVVGNDVSVIGSGPTAPDDSTFSDAMNVIEKYSLHDAPPPILTLLEQGMQQMIPENPQREDPCFKRCVNHVIGDLKTALDGAKKEAEQLGYNTIVYEEYITGDTEATALKFTNDLIHSDLKNTCIIAGGETTITVSGSGKGGRNQHFALTAVLALRNNPGISLLAAGTDGNDGPTDATGAFAEAAVYDTACSLGMNPESYLQNNDAYSFFQNLDALLKTGPTGTNVADIVIAIRE